MLYLTVNDDNKSDNSGEFEVDYQHQYLVRTAAARPRAGEEHRSSSVHSAQRSPASAEGRAP